MTRIFINYRRQDSEGYVGRITDHLSEHFDPKDIFTDVVSIKVGEDFVEVIEKGVRDCDIFIAVIGAHWLDIKADDGERRIDQEGDHVRLEIITALAENKKIIPILVNQAKMPHPAHLPEALRPLSRRNAIEISHHRFREDLMRLVEAIKAALPARGMKESTTSEVILQKTALLKAVRDDVVNAQDSPLYQFRVDNRLFPVVGEGNSDANLMFIGEAPGKMETEKGIPFCGASGDVLNEMLRSIELKREDVFITNLLLDRPPTKRDPLPEELAFYAPFIDRMIDIIQPKVIIALGRFAMSYLFKKLDLPEQTKKISDVHGKLIKTQLHYGEIHVVPLYHPAVVLYSATQKSLLQNDFQKLKLFI